MSPFVSPPQVAVLAGIAIGGDASFITSHNVPAGVVGTLGRLFFARIVHNIKIHRPRIYGQLVLGIACGIFPQVIVCFKNPSQDTSHTDLVLKLGACVILMVDGFSSFCRKPAERSVEKPAG